MARFFTRKAITALGTIWLATTLAFFALRILPGDAITTQLQGSGQPESVIEARRAAYHLDKSLPEQYAYFLAGVTRADLGASLYGGQTVTEILLQRFPSTLELSIAAMLIAIALGLLLGIGGGLQIPFLTPLARLITDLSFGVPIYWTATLVIFVLAISIGGTRNNTWLPALVLGFHTAGGIARIAQANIREVYQATYIQTARSKGLTEAYIMRQHALRAALLPIISVIALQTGILFSGTVITESIFSRAGIGLLLVDSILERNYPVVQGLVVVSAIIYVLVNTIADILYTLIDPRVQL